MLTSPYCTALHLPLLPPPPYPHPPLPRFHRAAQDAEFQDYAVKLVERVRAEGKNPLPIILQLQKNMRQSLAG